MASQTKTSSRATRSGVPWLAAEPSVASRQGRFQQRAYASYNVYHGTPARGESTAPIASGIATTSYTDSRLSSTTYSLKVAAVNSAGTGALSAEVLLMP